MMTKQSFPPSVTTNRNEIGEVDVHGLIDHRGIKFGCHRCDLRFVPGVNGWALSLLGHVVAYVFPDKLFQFLAEATAPHDYRFLDSLCRAESGWWWADGSGWPSDYEQSIRIHRIVRHHECGWDESYAVTRPFVEQEKLVGKFASLEEAKAAAAQLLTDPHPQRKEEHR